MKENFPKIFSIGSSPKKIPSCLADNSVRVHINQCHMDWISNVVFFFNVLVKDDVLESGHNIYLKMCFFF